MRILGRWGRGKQALIEIDVRGSKLLSVMPGLRRCAELAVCNIRDVSFENIGGQEENDTQTRHAGELPYSPLRGLCPSPLRCKDFELVALATGGTLGKEYDAVVSVDARNANMALLCYLPGINDSIDFACRKMPGEVSVLEIFILSESNGLITLECSYSLLFWRACPHCPSSKKGTSSGRERYCAVRCSHNIFWRRWEPVSELSDSIWFRHSAA